jgi:hypothetical protein
MVGGQFMIRQQEPLAAIEVRNRGGAQHRTDWYARLWFKDRPEWWVPQGRSRSSSSDMENGGLLSLRDAKRFDEIVDRMEQSRGHEIEKHRSLVSVEIIDDDYLRTSTEAISLVDTADAIRHKFAYNLASKGDTRFNGGKEMMASALKQISVESFSAYKSLVDGMTRSDEYTVDPAVEEAVAHFSSLEKRELYDTLSMNPEEMWEAAARLEAWYGREVGFNPAAFALGI